MSEDLTFSAENRVSGSGRFGSFELEGLEVWVADIERHEALSNRVVMKGHDRQSVAADGLKLRAA